ncbi:MAG TPA: DNA translocase FtsK 4TM domain-containing protein [Candidatus Saccharibacteria bacterium]|nr:DNA translocase FtsK 4TM domain-containing protein [Candidatus Saccharibacteria bacterium]MCB9817723.1 DNA translocase FtsK 4TM domain-containing protein [Candidatus Nomurabacteria bacterium]HPD98630.1 DNA translocase FtsK 4TM domain-containing protein [Candidatus Saccharibacteria bacterium]HPR09971.1 DNA translocase FtsK 4TM domain-containing protein [Candidatus Saccharibacteria bacterium]
MAKKKKTTKAKRKSKKIDETAPKTVSYFWRQVYAFALIVLAIFIFLGGFNMGGKLPISLFDITAWLVGFVAYIIPFVLIFLAIHKLRHEEFMIPIGKLLASLLFIVSLSGALHVFLSREDANSAAAAGTYGGHVGSIVSGVSLSVLNDVTSFILLLFLAWVGFMLMFGLSPKVLLQKFKNLFIREEADTDLATLKEQPKKLRMNENVPVEHHKDDEQLASGPRRSTFKNSVEPLTATENHAPLVMAADPNWKVPPLSLLSAKQDKADPGDVEGNAERIKQALANFGIEVTMEDANISARVTQYTMRAPQGVKMSKIANLADNISYELGAHSVRVEAPIPGKKAVGVEVPNKDSATVTLRSLLKRPEWVAQKSKLAFAVGQDIAGDPVYADLDSMPHLLIAGQTKSGKSVMVNTLLTSLLYTNSPADVKLILVDPKFVEMEPYNDIPHLLTPVINDPEKCVSALKWAVAEMERRYKILKQEKVREIHAYNEKMPNEKMPYIVIVIDELADLMQMAARDVEALIVRIAQKARAVGIHLVLATQSPRVTVITGLIKANVPARIAFTVSQEVESRIILDQSGAEKLLGYGDMLFYTTDMPKPIRVQGSLITTEETNKVTDFLREQQEPTYDDEIVSMPVQFNGKGGIVPDVGPSNSEDSEFKDAVRVVVEGGKASTSLLQRRLRIGYGKASRIIDEMEERGIVGPADGSRPREVLIHSVEEAFGSGATDDEDDITHIPVSDDPRDEYLTH